MGAFANRLGTRFLVVTVLPNVLLIGYVGLLLAAGAPRTHRHCCRRLRLWTISRRIE